MAWEDIVKQREYTAAQKINQKYLFSRLEFITEVDLFAKRYRRHVMPQFDGADNDRAVQLLQDILEDIQMELKRSKELAKLPKEPKTIAEFLQRR